MLKRRWISMQYCERDSRETFAQIAVSAHWCEYDDEHTSQYVPTVCKRYRHSKENSRHVCYGL